MLNIFLLKKTFQTFPVIVMSLLHVVRMCCVSVQNNLTKEPYFGRTSWGAWLPQKTLWQMLV